MSIVELFISEEHNQSVLQQSLKSSGHRYSKTIGDETNSYKVCNKLINNKRYTVCYFGCNRYVVESTVLREIFESFDQ